MYNWTTDWADGRAFTAIFNTYGYVCWFLQFQNFRPPILTKFLPCSFAPTEFSLKDLILDDQEGWVLNLDTAFMAAEEKLGIPQFLDGDDLVLHADSKSIYTYVMECYKVLRDLKPKVPLVPYTQAKAARVNKFAQLQAKAAAEDNVPVP